MVVVGIMKARPENQKAEQEASTFQEELQKIAPQAKPRDGNWHPGDAPSQVAEWAVQAVAKAGTLSIIGVYPPTDQFFPIGQAMNKNLSINMGNCNHRKYIPDLVELVHSGMIDPKGILTQATEMSNAIDAYKAFDERQQGWIKVELAPGL